MTGATERLRAEFPVAEEWAYLNHASYGPLPNRTVAAIRAAAEAFAFPPTLNLSGGEDGLAEAREQFAALVNGVPAQVAFLGSLADVMSLAANGIDWEPGDNVVIPQDEFPSVVYPFLNLERRGVEVRFVEKDDEGRTDLARIAARIDLRTRALVISHVEFMDGYRNDLDAIGQLCGDHDILSIVDGTQSVGALAIDVARAGIDVIGAHSYKWLLSGFGLGPVHLSERAIEQIRPVNVGRMGVEAGFEDLDYRLVWREGAARYQTGGVNWIALQGFNASVSLVREADPARTERHTLALTDRLIQGLERLGYAIASSLEPAHRSQIVAFTTGDLKEDEALVARLREHKVDVVLRGRGVRVSPYFYNTEADIVRLLDALPRR